MTKSKSQKKQQSPPTLSPSDTEGSTGNGGASQVLTVDNFGQTLQNALSTQGVQETLNAALGPLIELIVTQKVAEVEESFNAKIKDIKKRHDDELKVVKGELAMLQKRQGDLEQYSRREDLIIKGLQIPQTYAEKARNWNPSQTNSFLESEREEAISSPSLVESVTSFFEKDMGIQIPSGSISTAHPLPSKNGPSSIIVRFTSRDCRNRVYSRRFSLKGKKVYVDEHLTAANARLMYHGRQLKTTRKVLDCFTRNCNPFVRLLDRRVVSLNAEVLSRLMVDNV